MRLSAAGRWPRSHKEPYQAEGGPSPSLLGAGDVESGWRVAHKPRSVRVTKSPYKYGQ